MKETQGYIFIIYYVDFFRQTIILSSVALPEIKSIINRKCHNYAGKVVVENPPEIGTIQQVLVQVPQIFHR